MMPQPSDLATVESALDRLKCDAVALLGSLDVGALGTDPQLVLPRITARVLEALDADVADPRRSRALLSLGARAQDLLHDLDQHTNLHRVELLAQVRQGLMRLREITSSATLLDQVCAEAARSCGLRRVILSRVEGMTWYPWMVRFQGDQDGEREFIRHIRGITIDLVDAPIERRVIEEGRPRLVRGVTDAHAYGPMIEEAGTISYVVAPITPAGRVLGFLHAENGPDAPEVDVIDRDVLWVFAEGFGRIYERVELHERLRAQRSRIRETFAAIENITAAVDDRDIELARDADERLAPNETLNQGQMLEALEALLTEREREVLSLLVRGLRNAAIAELLVIKEGTVKTHVKHILRKVGAGNRAEVIARSMGASVR